MSELWGTLITFLPLIVIVFLANLAERARERSAGIPGPSSDVAGSTGAPLRPLSTPAWEEVTRLPSSLTDLPDDEPRSLSPSYAPAYPTTQYNTPASASQSDGTIYAVLAYILLSMIYGLSAAAGMLILLSAGVVNSGMAEMPPELASLFSSMNTNLMGWGLLLCSLAGGLVLLRPVRRALAGILPIDELSTVHAVALSFVALVLIQTVIVMGIGIENMAAMMVETAESTGESSSVSIFGAWFSALMMFLLGAIGVGWLVRRSLPQTIGRLGIVMPTVGQVIVSIALGFLMVGVIFALEWVSVMFGWGVDESVGELTELMLGGLMMSIPGVLTIGLAAGIGEEALMRGAVQPRLGLLLSSVTFALLHANYGITFSTLAVLIVGLVLGYVRIRYNTTSAMVVHATYNIILGLLAYYSINTF